MKNTGTPTHPRPLFGLFFAFDHCASALYTNRCYERPASDQAIRLPGFQRQPAFAWRAMIFLHAACPHHWSPFRYYFDIAATCRCRDADRAPALPLSTFSLMPIHQNIISPPPLLRRQSPPLAAHHPSCQRCRQTVAREGQPLMAIRVARCSAAVAC